VRGVLAVALKELRQIRRDRRSLLILLFIPCFFLFLYGYALNFDIRHVRLAVEDRDRTEQSRTLIAAFVRSTYFDQVASIEDDADVTKLLDAGKVRAVLVIPPGFSRELVQGGSPEVQILLDGENANSATTILGYANAVLGDASLRLAGRVRTALVGVAPRIWYNPELRSTLFLVPGLIAYLAMITAVVSTALSIVREKESGTMEQIRMAPISTLSFVLGKTVPYLVLSQASAFLVVIAAMALFGLPMRGDWLTLGLVVAVFLIGALGTGLLVSTIAPTQQVAFQMSMLIAFLPTFMLSGFIFPIASMPVPLQYITTIVPAKYFLIALRGVVLKGLGPVDLAAPLGALVVIAAVVIGLASVRLARR
jgi:ABC-2 type transport system permease protein